MKRDLDHMSRQSFDLLVIGGGITGACLARDAVMRGLKVALVEKADFGSATTAATSKLIHGGLRYLKNLEFGLVRESLRERRILERIAPHHVYPIPFLIPTYRKGGNRRPMIKAAMVLYDILSFDKSFGLEKDKRIPPHRSFSPKEVLEKEPGLASEGLTGGYLYYDCQNFNPERLCLDVILSASLGGAAVANYAEVVDLVRTRRKVTGARVRDVFTQKEYVINAAVTANVSGPWADRILGLCKGVQDRKVRRSKGIHIITERLTDTYALVFQTAGGRHFFIIPWRGYSLSGTTDTEFEGDPDHVAVTAKDLEDFVAEINQAYPRANLTAKSVRYCYAGLRPIVDQEVETLYEASRKYEIYDHKEDEDIEGFVTVIGGKYTTSRSLAEKVVTLILKKLGRPFIPSSTDKIPVHGGSTGDMSRYIERECAADSHHLGPSCLEHLIRTYGSAYTHLLKFLERDPHGRNRLCEAHEDIQAQISYAVSQEMCITLSDFLLRRTGLGTVGDPGSECVRRCAEILGSKLGWQPERIEREIEHFYEQIRVPS